jgi:hypothetical protein
MEGYGEPENKTLLNGQLGQVGAICLPGSTSSTLIQLQT